MRTKYGATDDVVVDDQSVNTVSTVRSRLSFSLFGRSHKNHQQEPSRGDDATMAAIDEEEYDKKNNEHNVASSSTESEFKQGKLLDLESLIGLCVVRLKIPEEEAEDDGNEEEEEQRRRGDIETGRLIKGPIEMDSETGLLKKPHEQVKDKPSSKKHLKSIFKGIKKGIKNASRSVVGKSSSFIYVLARPPKAEEGFENIETKQESQYLTCLAALCFPCKGAFIVLWGKMKTRVVITPSGLVLLWILIVKIESTMFKPIRASVDLVLPQIALVLDVAAIVIQCRICAVPLATGLAKLAGQLQLIIDTAFGEMMAMVPDQLAKILLTLKIPAMAAESLCKMLFKPFATVLETIFKIIPRVDSIIPPKVKDPKSLAPLIFVGLLIGLFLSQLLLLLVVGCMLSGTIEVLLGAAFCWGLGRVSLRAGDLIPFLVQVVETVLNTVIQSLLRKMLPVSKLQRTIDSAQSLIPKPPKLLHKKKTAKKETNRPLATTDESCSDGAVVNKPKQIET